MVNGLEKLLWCLFCSFARRASPIFVFFAFSFFPLLASASSFNDIVFGLCCILLPLCTFLFPVTGFIRVCLLSVSCVVLWICNRLLCIGLLTWSQFKSTSKLTGSCLLTHEVDWWKSFSHCHHIFVFDKCFPLISQCYHPYYCHSALCLFPRQCRYYVLQLQFLVIAQHHRVPQIH